MIEASTVLPSAITSCKFWFSARLIPSLQNQTGQVASATEQITGQSLVKGNMNAPTLVNSDGFPALRFDGTDGLANASLAINPSTAVVMGVAKSRLGYSGSGCPFALQAGGGGQSGGGLAASGSIYQYYWYGASGVQGAATDANTTMPTERHLAGFINKSGNTGIIVDGLEGAAITNTYNTTTAGFFIGSLNGNGQYPWAGDVFDAAVLDNPSASDIQTLINYFNAAYNLPIPPDLDQVLWINGGNSLAQGVDVGSPANTFWATAISKLIAPIEFRCPAKGGFTTPQLTALLPRDVYPLYNPKRRLTIYTFLEAINDYSANGNSVSTTTANTAAHFTAARTNMPLAKLGMPTVLPNTEMGETDRGTYNAWVRANWKTYADFIIDLAADPNIGQSGQNNAPNYDNSPGTHVSNAGAAYLGADYAAALNAIIRASLGNSAMTQTSSGIFNAGEGE